MTPASIATLLLILAGEAHGAGTKIDVNFTEDRKSKTGNLYLENAHKAVSDVEAQGLSQTNLIESARATYAKFHNRVRVPGFISASPIPEVGRIVGPDNFESLFTMGNTLFVRWSGAPMPKVGDRYATYAPAVVLQNMDNPTDFDVFDAPGPNVSFPKGRRLAGYMYETTSRVKITKVEGGLVYAMIEQASGHVGVGDQLMQLPPLLDTITPIRTGMQISAAVVCGSPVDRLSTSQRSFLYINRGSRDGIRVGRVFESIENVKLDESVGGRAPEISNGEAVVVHVTDAYSTVMITKQFDVIRMGSLLRAQQTENHVLQNILFQGANDKVAPKPSVAPPMPEIPNLQAPAGATDETLPEPRKRPSPPPLSELDEMEKGMNLKQLTPTEKGRLDKLSRQEKIDGAKSEAADEEAGENPAGPTVENSFKQGKKTAKKDASKKKSKSKNDEEELNLLMMQN